jgi:hypothetical protein
MRLSVNVVQVPDNSNSRVLFGPNYSRLQRLKLEGAIRPRERVLEMVPQVVPDHPDSPDSSSPRIRGFRKPNSFFPFSFRMSVKRNDATVQYVGQGFPSSKPRRHHTARDIFSPEIFQGTPDLIRSELTESYWRLTLVVPPAPLSQESPCPFP